MSKFFKKGKKAKNSSDLIVQTLSAKQNHVSGQKLQGNWNLLFWQSFKINLIFLPLHNALTLWFLSFLCGDSLQVSLVNNDLVVKLRHANKSV
jgi:hypothetical protein